MDIFDEVEDILSGLEPTPIGPQGIQVVKALSTGDDESFQIDTFMSNNLVSLLYQHQNKKKTLKREGCSFGQNESQIKKQKHCPPSFMGRSNDNLAYSATIPC